MFKIKRKTKFETRFHKNMGCLICKVTTIKKYLFGIFPIKTIHEYRETKYGEIKNLKECNLKL